MNISEIWIRRPVMTALVMFGLLFFGILSYKRLPINNLPDVDFPTISVTAHLPGANPETMAATVAMPLEKQFTAIAGIDSMTSTSSLGATVVNIQFSLDRDIDGAAQDVNAAISTALGVLPKNLPTPPTYRKVNPADMPIMFVALTSDSLPVTTLNDYGENILIARLASINGIAEVDIIPPQKYAVRVQVDPSALATRRIGLNEVCKALEEGNVNLPGGTLDGSATAYTLDSNGQLFNAKAYEPLIVAYQQGYPVRIRDIGRAVDGVENDKAGASYMVEGQRKQAVVLRVRKQPGSNTVSLCNQIRAMLPSLRSAVPAAASMDVFYDQSEFIRESIDDVQYTMVLTVVLVVVVVFLFIRKLKPTVIPSVVVPLSLAATFPVMSLLGYTLNNLSLMALTLSIGFVVDDAIVVLENIIRRMEGGESAMEASLRGSREIGFTVLSMTLSLAVVFIPIMFMSGILGRLFREFAVAITAAILFSGVLSLTLTPMLCSRFLGGLAHKKAGLWYRWTEAFFDAMLRVYGWSLRLVMKGRILILALTVVMTFAMIRLVDMLPKGFIPNQDQNFFRIFGQLSERSSFEDMVRHQRAMEEILLEDPDVREARTGSIPGFSSENTSLTFISLKRRAERKHTVDEIITRLRPKLNAIPGLAVSLVNPPVITIGSRLASAQWQYTLQGTEQEDLYRYSALLEARMRTIPDLTDVRSDLQIRKPQVRMLVDRDKASALGLTLKQIQDAFFSAYADRQVSTIYTATNFYYVILELLPEHRAKPPELDRLYIKSAHGELVPLSTVTRFEHTVSPLVVNHSGQIPSVTISFNLKPGGSIGPAVEQIQAYARATLPASIGTGFQGTAQAFQASIASMGFLLVVTLIVIYMVLGILYESFIHPLTILSALPLAGFGALAALWYFHMELDLYACVGIIMLVGIVKKNGIMMVDFALEAERAQRLSAERSIYDACITRFRPIMMTTMAALLGCLPIALGLGAGGEARQPLGIAVVGGLFFSQFLTLYVTPVIYVYLDKVNRLFSGSGGARTGDALS
jgi:hydrophobic/amphiphilic exporter-1 (mainly G- bacteria), HAE1 family